MTQSQVLFRCFTLLVNTGIWSKNKPSKWIKTLAYLHSKGWLYVDRKEPPDLCAAMYRVPDFKEELLKQYPTDESGNKLYIAFFASESEDRLLAKRLLDQYLKSNPDIDEIGFYDINDTLRRYKRTKKETTNGFQGRQHA